MPKKLFHRGSEWRIWDLHVHTPASLKNRYGGNSSTIWEHFISELEKLPADFKVIGINDYLFIDGYKKVLEYKQKGRLSNLDLILPVIEFRLKEFVGHDQLRRLNYHIIFADESLLSPSQIEHQFLSGLRGKAHLDAGTSGATFGGVITVESLTDLGKQIRAATPANKQSALPRSDLELGFNNINFELSNIEELLGESGTPNTYLANKYFKAIGKAEWEDFRWDGSVSDKKSIINRCHFIFCASPTPQGAIISKEKLIEQGVNSRVLHCSDAHAFSKQMDTGKSTPEEIGHCFTWVKADPTFEGLRQVIYEPDERSSLSDSNPSFTFDKPYFESLKVNDKLPIFESDTNQVYFQREVIPLNRNMVTIIGGRGSGKSLLIDYLATTFKKDVGQRESAFAASNDFTINYAKNNKQQPETFAYSAAETNYLDFLFIPQGQLKRITDSGSLGDEVKSLLELEDLSFSEQTTRDINAVLQEIEDVYEWFKQRDEYDVEINNKDVVQEEKQKNEQLLGSITTEENKEKLKTYSANVDKIQALETDKRLLLELKDRIEKDVVLLNELIEPLNKYNIPKFDHTKQLTKIEAAVKDIASRIETANQENEKIKETFKGVYTGDLSKLLKNVEVYRKAIKHAELKLAQIAEQCTKFDGLIEKRAKLGASIQKELERQCKLITNKWENILDQFEVDTQKDIIKTILKDRDIVVEGKIVFDETKFYELLKEKINLLYFKPAKGGSQKQKILDWIQVSNLDSFVRFIEKRLHSQYKDEEQRKKWLNGIDPSELFLDLDIRNTYLYTVASISYGGKTINKLSAGQKGTMFLCLQLARNAFSSPIIFDQPEDDLDNAFIVEDLVDIFKTLKRYRQIIIVTHNANLVVNADAEQVIVAKNCDEVLSYTAGALEDPQINKLVCKVLEGGTDAFEKRKNRYQMP